MDYVSDFGLLVDVGVGFGDHLEAADLGDWFIGVGGKLGYEFGIPTWELAQLRLGFRGLVTFSDYVRSYHSSPEFGECTTTLVSFVGLVETGIRWQWDFGLVLGFEIPVFAFNYYGKDQCRLGNGLRGLMFPFIYTQAYLGWTWRL